MLRRLWDWLLARELLRNGNGGDPAPVAVSREAAERLRVLKSRRPMTEAEHNCIAAISWQLGIPKDWGFDDEAMCFRPPPRS